MEAVVKEEKPAQLNPAELCSKEVNEVLIKYNCEIVCDRQTAYGQPLYVPMIILKAK